MAFDGMVTRAMANELSRTLVSGRVDKIYQPEKEELVFSVHSHRERIKLYISCRGNRPGIYMSEEEYDNPPQAGGFCMLMRKHLSGARISEISQVGAERIIEITFDTRNEMGVPIRKVLVVEVMGRHSNITLIHQDTRNIIDAVKHLASDVNRVRQILPGKPFTYPPIQGKEPFDNPSETSFNSAFEDPAQYMLNHIQGISPAIAAELAIYHEPLKRRETLQRMCLAIEENTISPRVYVASTGAPKEFHIFDLHAQAWNHETIYFKTLSQAISYYYENRDTSNRIKQKSSGLTHTVNTGLKKLYLKKQRLSEDLKEAENAEQLRLFGELLTANLHLISHGQPSITLVNYYDSHTVNIPLNKRFSPSKNAQQYYKKYNKAKRAKLEKALQLQETDGDILYLESVLSFIENAVTSDDVEALREELIETGWLKIKKRKQLKKGRPKSSFISYELSDGHAVLVGRNNKENDFLTFKRANKNDIWLHTKDIPGSHVILIVGDKILAEESLAAAASIAAYHSKAKDSANVPVDYTRVKHVKKPAGAKPGMVVFVNNKTLYVDPKTPGKTD